MGTEATSIAQAPYNIYLLLKLSRSFTIDWEIVGEDEVFLYLKKSFNPRTSNA